MFLLYCKVKKTSMRKKHLAAVERKKIPFLHHSFVAFLGATNSTAGTSIHQKTGDVFC